MFNSYGDPVNIPVLDLRLQATGNQRWAKFLEDGIIPVVSASFVGTLISRQAIGRYGLPIAEMFIWGDDTEFTFRMTADGEAGYVAGSSRIVHLGRGVEVSIIQERNLPRIKNFYYFYRNNIYVLRKYGTKQATVAFVLRMTREIVRLGIGFEMRKLIVVLRGLAGGLLF